MAAGLISEDEFQDLIETFIHLSKTNHDDWEIRSSKVSIVLFCYLANTIKWFFFGLKGRLYFFLQLAEVLYNTIRSISRCIIKTREQLSGHLCLENKIRGHNITNTIESLKSYFP